MPEAEAVKDVHANDRADFGVLVRGGWALASSTMRTITILAGWESVAPGSRASEWIPIALANPFAPRHNARMAPDAQASPAPRADPGLFATTRWSVVLRAQDHSDAALGTLCEAYRQPLVTWLRIRGFGLDDAEDLVQGFFAHILAREFLANIGRDKGKFRTFVLKCFQHYLSDERDRISAHKRGGGRKVESLEQTGPEGHRLYDPAGGAAPDLEFDRACARSLLERARSRLQAECAGQGHAALYSELEPGLLAEEGAASYKEVAARLGVTEQAVKVAAHRIRVRLRGLMREEVLQTVASEEDWQEEIRYLIGLFSL